MSMPRSTGAHAGVVVFMLAAALALRPLPTMAENPDADANAKWSIAMYAGASPFVLAPIEGERTPILTAADVPAFPTRFVADPFLARSGGTWFLFFEALNEQSGHGDIAYATSTDGRTWTYGGVALDESFHLSYPYVFEWQGTWYMVPETHLRNDVRLYRAVSFPSQWVLDTTLVSGRPYADPSLVQFGGRWWLFVSTSTNSNLYLFSAPDLRGPYTAHPQSPVVQGDATRARPGGRLLVRGGQLFRFAQDDAELYGRRVRAFEIATLTPTSYAEVEVPESPVVGPHGCGWARDGMHTVDPMEVEPGLWLASVDGRGEPTSSEGLPKSAWRVHAVDSEPPPAGATTHAFDDRCDTAWRTAPGGLPPHELVIDLAGRYTLDAVRYWAPTDPSGRIGDYELYVSEDGLTWGSPVATGTFTDTAAGQLVAFQPKTGTFLRLRALSEMNGGVEVGATELDVFGATAVGNQAPESVIDQPAASAVTIIDVGSTVTFTGGGFDPDGNLPLSFHWSFGVGSGVPDSLDQDPGPVRFDVPGVFTVTLSVSDALGLADPAPTTRTVAVVDPAIAMRARDWSGAFTAWWGLDDTAGGPRANNAGGSSCGGTPSSCDLTLTGTVGLTTTNKQQGTGAADSSSTGTLSDTETVFQPSGAVTYGGWMRITDETTNRVAIHRRQFSTTGYELTYVQTDDRLTCKAQDKSVAITDANTAGTYAFAVCTWDGTNLRAYGNGRAPTSTSLTTLTPGTAALTLGGWQGTNPLFTGQLDEIGLIRNRALTEAEICRWCSCGIQGGLCTCNAATPGQYLTTGRNAAACNSCTLPACNASAPGVPTPTPTSNNQLPNGTINTPSIDTTISVGGTVSFTGTGTDADGPLPLGYLWNFGAGSGVPSSTVEDPGPIQFNTPGTFTVTFTVTDGLGQSDPTPGSRVVTVLTNSPLAAQTTLQLWRADSEELATAYHPALLAFDGDPGTFWQSRMQPSILPFPHDLEINLGGLYQVNGLRYLPRQDTSSEGRVGQYQLYVSADGATWGNPVASGTFADHGAAKEVTFSPIVGQFVRFRALSDLGGSTITNVAELNVLGTCVTPSVTIAPPQDYALQPAPDLAVVANACLDPLVQAGWGVRLRIDGGSAVDDYTPPFALIFPGLTQAEHVPGAQLIDALGTPVGGAAGYDQLTQVGIGNFLVAVGDSITEGLGDNVASDDTSADGRDRSVGYPPILNNLLTTATGVPHTVVNRGAAGARSAWGAQVMANMVARYPLAQRFLILIGTNDASIFFPIPSGLGLHPGDPGYPGSFKDNLQQMLDAVNAAGKEAIVLKVPVTLASCSTCTPYPDPDTGQRNVQLVKPFNQVIDELVADPVNNVSIVPPDLYAYFLQHYATEYVDILHPNGVGYQSVARLVCQAITQAPCIGGP